ncbi:hypothetical protein QE442_000898 [Chryseobacterium sp. SORGH_AS1175]|nr:hypothetical protein [Chryseobacterium sp. SORGH_AS_1175]
MGIIYHEEDTSIGFEGFKPAGYSFQDADRLKDFILPEAQFGSNAENKQKIIDVELSGKGSPEFFSR